MCSPRRSRPTSPLSYPTASVGSGVITITLTWGSQPDVDLHVFEPGGTHVYYRQLQGTPGYLDRDDVNGFGSEHYYVSCADLKEGDYKSESTYANARAAHPVEVRVADVNGRAVVSLPVYFELGDGRAGMLVNGAQSGLRVRAVPDSRGVASATLAVGDHEGSARLTASLGAQSGDRAQSVGSDVFV